MLRSTRNGVYRFRQQSDGVCRDGKKGERTLLADMTDYQSIIAKQRTGETWVLELEIGTGALEYSH